jgi:two-component system, LuxR family, response regulator FixJ
MAVAQQPAVAIVDDDPGISRSLSSLLAVSGHRVQTFVSAVEFQKADIRVFACLILDYHMPEMTGLHLAEWLRGEGSPIPIMLVTGLPSSTITARAAELGIERVLEKPLNERDLLGFIASSLRQRELDD